MLVQEKIGKRPTNIIEQNDITFLLGPTNTGKTFYAIERMLTHSSGYFGLPLRLLAKEIYDKIVNRVSKVKVALITGEEQIIPRGAKYFISTVEAMPSNLNVDFVAVDEIQLCNDYERGHIFTDKLLHARGDIETIFLGSSSMENIVSKMFPRSKIIQKERRSKIIYAGRKSLFSLPKRTAIVAFNMNEIYNIASKIKALKGGAAIVMGSLSPQTRNAQVSMFEEGTVDYIVATDAIGMGLNLNIDHVALSSRKKFDGKSFRYLTEGELAQIVGRAGRNKKDGTFGTTLNCKSLDSNTVSSIEKHLFKPINFLYWRSRKLDFSNYYSLIKSLEEKSNHNFLIKTQNTEDENILKYLASVKEVEKRLTNPDTIKLLWEISSIPNYLKNFGHSFSDLLIKIFCDISSFGRINTGWILKQLKTLNSDEDSIDMITFKLAKTRFWNFLSNRSHWIKNNNDIKDLAQKIEKELSEKLHNKLIDEFIDKKLRMYLDDYRIKSNNSSLHFKDGKIYLNEKLIGEFTGLKVIIFDKNSIFKNKNLKNIISLELKRIYGKYVNDIISKKNLNVSINKSLEILIDNRKVGSLYKGKDLYTPNLLIESNNYIEEHQYLSFSKKISHLVSEIVNDSFTLSDKVLNSNILKSIFFLISEGHGFFEKAKLSENFKQLKYEEKSILKSKGIIIGFYFIYDAKIFDNKFVHNRWKIAKVYNEKRISNEIPKNNILRNTEKNDLEILRTIGYQRIDNFYFKINYLEYFFKRVLLSKKRIYIINNYHYKKFNLNYLTLCSIMKFFGFSKIAGTKVVTYWEKYTSEDNNYSRYDKKSPFYILKKLKGL